MNLELHRSASHKEVEDILRECLEEVKTERHRSQQKTRESLQGVHSARRAEEKEAARARIKGRPEQTINPSQFSLATFKGVEKEVIEGGNPVGEEYKGHEKRRIIEKFLNNDEIFMKILNIISPTINQIESARASHTTQTRTH